MNKIYFQSTVQIIICKFTLLLVLLMLPACLIYAEDIKNSSFLEEGHSPDNPSDSTKNSYRYKLSYDKKFSSIVSADLILSVAEFYRIADDATFNNPDNFLLSFSGYLSRMFVTAMLSTIQHEFGGHGSRLREFGVDVKGYAVNIDGSGHTSFDSAEFDRLHSHKKIASIIGGVESNYFMSQKLAARFLAENTIHPVNAMLYIWSATDQVEYVFSMKKHGESEGHDIADYIKQLNRFYGDGYVTRSKLRKYALFDLLDPMLYFSAYSFVSNERMNTPMIDIGDYSYLPAFRSVLAPYGPEIGLINYIKYEDSTYTISFFHGKNQSGKSYNINFLGNNLYKIAINGDIIKDLSTGIELGIWRQPKLFDSSISKASIQSGILTEITLNFNILDKFGINIATGYKSRGFVMGRTLTSSGTLRLGLEFSL